MKKFVIASLTLAVLVVTCTTLSSAKGTEQRGEINFSGNSIPDSLNVIFKNSCTSCHSDGGNLFAKGKVNFTEWDNYTQKEKVKKANNICEMISKGEMPPKSARKSKPETIPTASQITAICKWATSLSQEK